MSLNKPFGTPASPWPCFLKLQAHYNMSTEFRQAILYTNIIVTVLFFLEFAAKWVVKRISKSLCVCMCFCVCDCVCFCVWLCVFMCVCVFLCLCVCVCVRNGWGLWTCMRIWSGLGMLHPVCCQMGLNHRHVSKCFRACQRIVCFNVSIRFRLQEL